MSAKNLTMTDHVMLAERALNVQRKDGDTEEIGRKAT